MEKDKIREVKDANYSGIVQLMFSVAKNWNDTTNDNEQIFNEISVGSVKERSVYLGTAHSESNVYHVWACNSANNEGICLFLTNDAKDTAASCITPFWLWKQCTIKETARDIKNHIQDVLDIKF